MTTLYIDLASNTQALALVEGDKVVALEQSAERFKEQDLMPMVQKMLGDRPYADIQRIACVTGPGGFMSLRVGVSLANALSFSLGVPVAPLHVSDIWAARVDGPFVWLHSTKRAQVFIRGFGDYAKEWPEAVVIDAQKLSVLEKGTPVAGELISEHAQLITHCARIDQLKKVEDVLPEIIEKMLFQKDPITPWYGREG